ncbi:uncharacterized protein MELLADRAFT_92379 [Melampsora larici-populina 98AG31]|uniref:Secreted protein n=1 Tax=Melampsora larici-populina (strain 98AG31 / pathotype 3-4-7) TaxID=747676 RepID=F4R9E7_MELLP|nr:uncharacterized protein MELLADRAFT_92379 [Melampsora larici-populina 98AG31]EGG11168.1 secreted protein [Melampsora larici-populina 98AG31]
MSDTSQRIIKNLLSFQFYLALAVLWLFSAQIVISSPIPHPNPALFGEAADLGHLAAQGGRSTSLGGLDAGKIAKNVPNLYTIPESSVLEVPKLSRSKAVAPGRSKLDPFELSPGPEIKPGAADEGKLSELTGTVTEVGKTGVEAGSKVNMGIGNLGYLVKNVKTGLQRLLNRVSKFYTKILISRVRSSALKEWNLAQKLSQLQTLEKDGVKSKALAQAKQVHFKKMEVYNLKAGKLLEKLKSITH